MSCSDYNIKQLQAESFINPPCCEPDEYHYIEGLEAQVDKTIQASGIIGDYSVMLVFDEEDEQNDYEDNSLASIDENDKTVLVLNSDVSLPDQKFRIQIEVK